MDLRDVLDGAIADFQWWIQGRLSRLRGMLHRRDGGRKPKTSPEERITPWGPGGPLVLAADGRLTDTLTLRLLHLARGRGSRVVVVGGMEVAFSPPARHLARQLARFGVEKISALALVTRADAEDPRRWDLLLEGDLVIVAGQDPEQGSYLGADSPFATALTAAHRRGIPMALLGGAATLAGGWLRGAEGQGLSGWHLLPQWTIASPASHGYRFLTWLADLPQAPRALRWGLWLEKGTAILIGDGYVEAYGKPGGLVVPLTQFRSEGLAVLQGHLLLPGVPWRFRPPVPEGPADGAAPER